jgi:HK97 family phage portal protein
MVKPARDSTGKIVYTITAPDGDQITLARATATGGNIWHIPAFKMPGAITGMSPIAKARQGLALAMAAEEYGARFFSNDARAGGIIEFPAGAKPSQETIKSMLLRWKKHHQGTRNAHMPGVLEGGATWKQITISPDEAQFLDTRRFSVTEVARLFRVPPHLISDVEKSTSWGTGIEEQNLGWITYSLRPWLERLEQATNIFLPGAAFVKFNVEGLLRAQTEARYSAHATAIQWGFKNVDEVRALEDMPPLPDRRGQVYLRPANMLPSDQPAASE